ncbi:MULTISPECIES: methyl-accepting chemotaxis protein [unclassified Shewanella]|uniref:methyl-accepting chemotaxis protein n=1 Tax=Shewanella TaxID=22 RepID=UPI001B553D4A|nr:MULTISPECIES: methyl-accepting chemotaxis protein [unclassified Shewanella]MBP6520459.1 PAS domain-containing protein [Shewanella sp.]MCU7998533.1 methyl-accepting chemotaxis protein [Shewanella sp. SM95]MCU8023533.1 methyl-accepting chemotaxis protein [Shewanella sp. SM78]MCU8046576.1 methyl-accepting chemotaxis protein [Shewanella sp. SM65]MCU8080570.1 methyl-accepting chemotaxis protein [Shewanella sp. SM103]
MSIFKFFGNDEAREQRDEERQRYFQLLDNSGNSFMIADSQRNIIYANKAVVRLLQEAEDDIRKELPQFSVAKLIGSNIDIFHKNPAHQRNLLERLTQSHTAQITIGKRTFRLILTPIITAENKHLGTGVEWIDRTESIEAERATQRILEALNNTSTNVMIADANRTIIYMNRSVETMLRHSESEIRQALPHFSVDKILGSSMDIFHRNPAHQASLLDKLDRKYESLIKVASCHFRLTASPIVSKEGERLGTVVEWLDRTIEVQTEQEISRIVTAAAAGDFSQRAETDGKQGFFLMLANNLNSLIETSERGLQDVARVLMALADGDLTTRIYNDYEGTFDDLKNYSNQTAEKLSFMIQDIQRAADTINTASAEIAQGNADLSSRTEEQASSLEQTSASMEELTGTVKLNADNASQANALASKAAEVAVDGGELIQQVVQTMASINESARKIADIIGVIDGIAFQTNILALNAAVEAARAGEQGRGFAVVASEVRSLAQRSANAAKDIKALISDSVSKIESGNSLVGKSGDTMKEIVIAIKRVNDIMAEIASASNEQAIGIDEISKAVVQMDEMTQQNAALVEEAAAAAESMQSQAQQLSDSVASFRVDDEDEAPRRSNARLAAPKAKAMKPIKQQLQPMARARVTEKPKTNAMKPMKQDQDEWEEF